MWSSSLAAVALAAALEASPAQNAEHGYDYLVGDKFVEPVTTVSGTAQTVRPNAPAQLAARAPCGRVPRFGT